MIAYSTYNKKEFESIHLLYFTDKIQMTIDSLLKWKS